MEAKGPRDVENRGAVNVGISKLAYAPAGQGLDLCRKQTACNRVDRLFAKRQECVSLQGLGDFRGKLPNALVQTYDAARG